MSIDKLRRQLAQEAERHQEIAELADSDVLRELAATLRACTRPYRNTYTNLTNHLRKQADAFALRANREELRPPETSRLRYATSTCVLWFDIVSSARQRQSEEP